MPKEEFLKALNARLILSIVQISASETEDARRRLLGLSRLLPDPEERHLEAARATHRHDQIHT